MVIAEVQDLSNDCFDGYYGSRDSNQELFKKIKSKKCITNLSAGFAAGKKFPPKCLPQSLLSYTPCPAGPAGIYSRSRLKLEGKKSFQVLRLFKAVLNIIYCLWQRHTG